MSALLYHLAGKLNDSVDEEMVHRVALALAPLGVWLCVMCGGWYNAGGDECECCGASRARSVET